MTDKTKQVNRFEKYGQALLDNGFNCIPIIPFFADHPHAGKAPAFKNWQRSEFSEALLQTWIRKYSRYGIGIQTRFFPAVDIDCTDSEGAEYMANFVEGLLGTTIKRIGRAPKILLLFRTDLPFTKVKSHVWIDDLGDRHAVEILGSGQQFVSYGVHPGTKKPYKWVGTEHPANIDADLDLPEIDVEKARTIIREFDTYARSRGWTADPKLSAINGGEELDAWNFEDGLNDDEDWLTAEDLISLWEGTTEELAAIFEDLPPEDSYDRWFPVLAALKDAEREPDEFKEIAREWSSRSENYDETAFEDKWDNGSFNRVVGRMLSVHSIARRVDRIRRETEVTENIIPDFKNCVTLNDWRHAAERMRQAEVFGSVRDAAVEIASEAYKRVTGLKKVPKSAIEELAFDFSQFETPEWLQPWVFNRQNGTFIDRRNLQEVGPYSFNLQNARPLREKGVKKAADKFVAEDFPIPIVDGVMYYPKLHGDMDGNTWTRVAEAVGHGFFRYRDKTYLNTFNPDSMPAKPERLSKADQRAVEVVRNFFEVIFTNPVERRYVMDWLAWVINNPTRRISYALIIVGCEGSGKSIIKKMMQYVLGAQNVGTVSNTVLMKSFTDWANGHILKVLEEIDIPGHRYDVVNVLKEPIANEDLQTEAKFATASPIVNTASYLGFTNNPGAIPVGDESRRYLIAASRFQDKNRQLLPFMAENPRFYKNFEMAITRHPGAIRKWFESWEYSPEFNHEGHAPDDTVAKSAMRSLNVDPFVDVIETAIDSGDWIGITPEAIHSTGVSAALQKLGMKSSSFVARLLAQMGYSAPGTGRVRVRLNGVLGSVYVKDPEQYKTEDGTYNLAAVARILQKHADDIDKTMFD